MEKTQVWISSVIERLTNTPTENYNISDRKQCLFKDNHCEECRSGIREIYTCGDATRKIYDVSKCYEDYRYRFLLDKSGVKGIGLRQTFENYTVDRFNKSLHNALLTWDYKKGKGIYIAAEKNPANPQGNGTGKTYGLYALVHKLCKSNVPCLFATTTEFFMEIRATYGEYAKEDEMRILDKYKDVPVLFWDDMGKENISKKNNEWAPEKMLHVIDERVKRGKPMVISSNFAIEQLEVRFGEENHGAAIISRLLEHCEENYHFIGGPDRRISK